MRKQLCGWLVCSAAVFAPALAHAEDEPKAYPECTKGPTDAETAAAKGAYQAGNASFDEADYPRAITYWEDAYRRDCTANLLLKNLARAYELYGQKRQAVVALETFLVREPGSADKEQIQRRIEVLKKQIAAEKAAPAPGGTQAAPVTTPATTSASAEPGPAPVEYKKRSAVPLVVAGVGGAVAIVGGVLFVVGSRGVNKYEGICPNHNCDGTKDPGGNRDAANSERNKKIAGGVMLGVGAAGIAGGLIWYFAQPHGTQTATGSLLKPQVSPAVSPGFAGLALSGAF
ncbi:MAG: hypothetical protein ABJB12_09180 [Pseudomonadota bacterium]